MQSASSALTLSRHYLQCHRGWSCKALNNCRPTAPQNLAKREYISRHEPIKQVLRTSCRQDEEHLRTASKREPVDLEKWSAERVQAKQSRPCTSPCSSLMWAKQGLVVVIFQLQAANSWIDSSIVHVRAMPPTETKYRQIDKEIRQNCARNHGNTSWWSQSFWKRTTCE